MVHTRSGALKRAAQIRRVLVSPLLADPVVEGVMSAYDIRSRGSRDVAFAELTISVDRRASVQTAHRIADTVETRLRTHHRLHQIIVHIEPC